MKIAGKKISGPAIEIIPIIRGDEEIILKAQAVLDYDEFYQICPIPKPPEVVLPGGERRSEIENPDYKKKLTEHSNKKYAWMILKSLAATPSLEWETVDLSKPETWENYEKELKDSGFTEQEIFRIIQTVVNVQGLDNKKIEEARKRFLVSQVQESKSS